MHNNCLNFATRKIAGMYKSIVILLGVIWLICAGYLSLTRIYPNYPYGGYAMAGSWIASFLLLISIVVFIKKHGKK